MATVAGGKMVYRLAEGNAQMVQLLGGKGAHASEMARIGIPVPPGFVITTEACREYLRGHAFPEGLWESIVENVHTLERELGRTLGAPSDPLVVSVRSGAPVSMPGMMDTILNMGVTEDTWRGLAAMMGDERPALDAYRRFIQAFGNVVLGIDKARFEDMLEEAKRNRNLHFDYELPPEALLELVAQFEAIIVEATGQSLSRDPWVLLKQAIEAVFTSWNNPRAITYRDFHGIPHDIGTGCVIMAMVFGNLGTDSGTGVLFTRSPATGNKRLFGEFLANAQGEDVVAGVRTPSRIDEVRHQGPDLYEDIERTARDLEAHYGDVQDIEFTIERGKLYILQTRTAKRTASAAVKIAVDLVDEGVLTPSEALGRIHPEEVVQVLMPRFDPGAKSAAVEGGRLFAEGLGGSPGAASGIVVMDPDRAVDLAAEGKRVMLVRHETSPDDVHGIIKAEGVLTARGGMTSHAAVVTRGLGKPAVVGCEELEFTNGAVTARGRTLNEGDLISVDGATGEVFVGELATQTPRPQDLSDLGRLLNWADEVRSLQVWANADTPEDAERARANGAQGVGLCRTEHMFFDPERLPHVQQLLHVGPEASRLQRDVDSLRGQLDGAPASQRDALTERLAESEARLHESDAVESFRRELGALEDFQTQDFYGILKAMAGLPVTIRLLDAPLHEFAPHDDALAESNPMLGHRGTRVGLTMPEVYEMQVRAIFSAAAQLAKEGVDVHPEVMIPIVSHVNELRWLGPRLSEVARATLRKAGASVPFRYGTMIEVPRAALTAEAIAQEVTFFSFGSNDLTQMTFAYSRDDAEGKFLRHYVETDILPWNPFERLDRDGVGRLMRLATEEGRRANPSLQVGICGEHGGDPMSIAFCHDLGLNYVSCSPFRVPVARLAAAQSALGQMRLPADES